MMRPTGTQNDVVSPTQAINDQSLADLLEQVTRALDEGNNVDVSQLYADYPQHSDRLRELMPTMMAMASWGRSPARDHDARESLSENPLVSHTLGDFRIIRELGRGGMGTVFEAQQLSMSRRVALKVLPFATLVQEMALQRFRNEVRAAAALDHPHIVSIYSVGEHRGIHYYSMQLVRGQSLAELILHWRADLDSTTSDDSLRAGKKAASNKLMGDPLRHPGSTARLRFSTMADSRREVERYRAVARLAIQAAEALQHAHDQGVTHRDIKPGNLLIDTEGKLYVTDFGLARIETGVGLTMTGDLIGTLRYMAPEQAMAKRISVDHRADIYSLGVTLYESLVLRPALESHDRSELLKQIAFDDPIPLRKIDRRIPIELETIVGKAIEKNPDDRYVAAEALADDLRRYLENRPILARPPSLLDSVAKWSRRHLGVVYTAASLTFILVCVLLGSTLQLNKWYHESERQTKIAHERLIESQNRQSALQSALANESAAHDRALRNLYISDMRLAPQLLENGRIAGLHALLDKHLSAAVSHDQRGWEWYYFLGECHEELYTFYAHTGWVYSIAMHPSGTSIASCGADNAIRIWNIDDYRFSHKHVNDRGVYSLAFHPSGKTLASGERFGRISLRDASTARLLRQIQNPRHNGWVGDVSWSQSGKYLGSQQYGVGVHLQEVDTGKIVKEFPSRPDRHPHFSWDPTSDRIAYPAAGRVNVFDLHSRHDTVGFECKDRCLSPDWASDGRRIAWGITQGVRVGDLVENKVERQLDGGVRQETDVRWSPDATRIAAANEGASISIWNIGRGNKVSTILGHLDEVSSIAWTPDGDRLVSGSLDGTIRIWDVNLARDTYLPVHDQRRRSVDWSRDGSRFAAVDAQGVVSVGSANSRRPEAVWDSFDAQLIAWHPNGDLLAIGGADGHVHIVSASSGETVCGFIEDSCTLRRIRWNSEGTLLAIGSRKHGDRLNYPLSVRALIDLREVLRFDRDDEVRCKDVSWSPRGNRVVFCGQDGMRIVDVFDPSAELHCELPRQAAGQEIGGVDWNPDGSLIAATSGSLAWVVDSSTGQPVAILRGHGGETTKAAWSPDGTRLATASRTETIIWEPQAAAELTRINEVSNEIVELHWRPDGKMLVKLDKSGKLSVWDASRGYDFAASPLMEIDRVYRDIVLNGNFEAVQRLCELAKEVPHRKDIDRLADDFSAQLVLWHALILLKSGDEKAAVDHACRIADLHPEDPRGHLFRALKCFLEENYDVGIATLEELVQTDPNSNVFAAELLNHFAWPLATAPDEHGRNAGRAIELATIACELTEFEVANHLDTLAAAFAAAGDYEAAAKWSAKSIELEPENQFFAEQLKRYRRKEPSQSTSSGETSVWFGW